MRKQVEENIKLICEDLKYKLIMNNIPCNKLGEVINLFF